MFNLILEEMEEAEKLYQYFEKGGKLEGLNGERRQMFMTGCRRAVKDNPDLGFDDLLVACRIYQKLIEDFPTLSVKQPGQS